MKRANAADSLKFCAALAATWLGANTASAHTDSLGFVINPGASSGLYNVDIYYGSWHSSVPGPEGALDLSLADSTPVGTSTFQLVPGFNGVSDDTLPAGLVLGVNYFFPNYGGGFDEDTNNHDIFAFQYVSFLGLQPGSYVFGYNAGSSLTIYWTPSDPMINAGAFVIGSGGGLVVVGASSHTIDLSQPFFTSDEYALGGDAIFDGGTLQMAAGSETMANNFTVNAPGGTIDTADLETEFDGSFSGDGAMHVTGGGSVTLTGANINAGGFSVSDATLRAGDDSALGDADAALTLDDGVFSPTEDMSLNRDVVLTAADGSELAVGNGLTLTMNGALSGDSCLYKAGAGTLDLRADGANAIGACVQQGLLAFNSTFTGHVWVDPDGVISGNGHIVGDVDVSGTLSPGNSPGQLVVSGSVTLADGSTTLIQVDGLTVGVGAGHYDTLVLIGGSSVFTANGTLDVALRGISAPATNTFTPAIGDTFQIVTAEGGVTGAFDTLVQPSGGLAPNTRFDVIYGANDIELVVTPASYAVLLEDAGRDNVQRLAAALDAVRPDPGVSNSLFDGLAGLDEAQLRQTMAQLAGDIHVNSIAAAHRTSRMSRDAVLQQPDATAGRRVWGEAIGSDADVNASEDSDRYKSRARGLAAGADMPLGEHFIVGGAVAYAETHTSGTGVADAQSYQLMAYGRWSAGQFFARGVLAYSADSYDIQRAVTLASGPEALSANVDGRTFAFDVQAGRRVPFGLGHIDFLAGLSWDRVSRDSFHEDGAGSVALTFARQGDSAVTGRLGGRYDMELRHGAISVRPYAEAYVVTAMNDVSNSRTTASLNGADFQTRSADDSIAHGQIGLGMLARLPGGAEVFARYDGTFASDHSEQGGQVGVRVGL